MDQHVNIWTKKTLYACMLIGLCSCSLAVPNGTSILLLDNFFFHRNLILGILNFTGLSTGLTSIFLYRAQPWCCCKLPIQLTLFLLKVKIHWNPWYKYEGWQNSYAICYIKVLFHFYYYWGKKHHSSDWGLHYNTILYFKKGSIVTNKCSY